MNLYWACIRIGIWSIVKARAEVWQASGSTSPESLQEIKDLAKRSYRSLSMLHHPDKGGDHDNYLEIQSAFDSVKSATVSDFIQALDEEKKSLIKYYEPGSEDCRGCGRWSDIVGMCITVTCSGFQAPGKPRFANILNKFAVALGPQYSGAD